MRDRALLLVSMLLLAAPHAIAQSQPVQATVDVSTEGPGTPIPVDGREVAFRYEVTYRVDGPVVRDLRIDMDLQMGIDMERWKWRIEPAHHVFKSEPGLSHTFTAHGLVFLAAPSDAQAFLDRGMALVANAPGDELVAQDIAGAEFMAAADWRPGLQVTLQQPIVRIASEGGQGIALAELNNLGNGRVDVRADLITPPAGCEAHPALERVSLEPRNAFFSDPDVFTRDSHTIDLTCADGWTSGDLTVRYTQHIVGTDLAGPPVTVQWTLAKPGEEAGSGAPRSYGARDSADGVPGPALALWILALVGVAIARRRPV